MVSGKSMKEMNIKMFFCTIVFFLSFPFLHITEDAKAQEPPVPKKYFTARPPLSEGIYPCSQCHAGMEANPERRELMFHTEIAEGFNHAEEQRWCLDCHNPDDRDKLRLVGGKLISFEESYELCGQCHGTIYRDWKVGVHGRRTGQWNGKKEYRLCVHCHYPHWPRFAPLKPLPPPIKPYDIRERQITSETIPLNPLGDMN